MSSLFLYIVTFPGYDILIFIKIRGGIIKPDLIFKFFECVCCIHAVKNKRSIIVNNSSFFPDMKR